MTTPIEDFEKTAAEATKEKRETFRHEIRDKCGFLICGDSSENDIEPMVIWIEAEIEKARQQGREEAIDFVEQYGGYSLGNYSLLDDWKERIRKLK